MSVTNPSAPEAALVVFLLDAHRYAVELPRVERVVRRVALTPLPQAPAIVLGVFDLGGEMVPVVDARSRFRLPRRAPSANDQFLLVRTERRRLAFVVDDVLSVTSVAPGTVTPTDALVPGLEFLRGILRLPETGIVLIHDVDTFLSLDEEARLGAALKGSAP